MTAKLLSSLKIPTAIFLLLNLWHHHYANGLQCSAKACDPSKGRGDCGLGCICTRINTKNGMCKSADSHMQPASKQPLYPEETAYYEYDQLPTPGQMVQGPIPGGVAGLEPHMPSLLPAASNTHRAAGTPGGGVTRTSPNPGSNMSPGVGPDKPGGTVPTTSYSPKSNVHPGGVPGGAASTSLPGGGMPDAHGGGLSSMSYEDSLLSGGMSGAQGGDFSPMAPIPGGGMGVGAVPGVPAGGGMFGLPGGATSQMAGSALPGAAYMPGGGSYGGGMPGLSGGLGGLGAPRGSPYSYDYYGQGGMNQMGGRMGSMGHSLLGALGSMVTGAAGSMYGMPGVGMGGLGSMYRRQGVGMGGFGTTAIGNMQYGSYDYADYTSRNQMPLPQQIPAEGQSQPSAPTKTPEVPSPNGLPPPIPPRSPQPSAIPNKNLPPTPLSPGDKTNPEIEKVPKAAPISRPSVSPTPAPRHRTLPGVPPLSPKLSSSSKNELSTSPSAVGGKGKPDIGNPDRPLPPRTLVRPSSPLPPPPVKRVSLNTKTPHAPNKPLQARPLTKPLRTPPSPPKPSMIDVGGGKPPLYTQPIRFPRPKPKPLQRPVKHLVNPLKKFVPQKG